MISQGMQISMVSLNLLEEDSHHNFQGLESKDELF